MDRPRGAGHLPDPIVKRLNAEMHRIVAVPEVRERLIAMGGDPQASTPEEMKALIARQYELWKGLAKETGISIN